MSTRRHTGRATFVVRGIAGIVTCAVVVVAVIAGGAGAFNTAPIVTARLTGSSVAVAERAPVHYSGVVVGSVASTRTTPAGVTLALRMAPEAMDSIPAEVRVRVLPRTLFGNKYVELVPPEKSSGHHLRAGAVLAPDRSAETVRLNEAYHSLYRMLGAIEPAKLSQALAAVSTALRGEGDDLGRMIDKAYALTTHTHGLVSTFSDTLSFVADLSEQLSRAAPRAFEALADATELSRQIVAHRDDIAAILSSGMALAEQATRFLKANRKRLIRLVEAGSPVLHTLASHAPRITRTLDSFDSLADAASDAMSNGPWLTVNLNLSARNLLPYTAQDCPRYGELTGPNCVTTTATPERAPAPRSPGTGGSGQRAAPTPLGGTSGPVGSRREQRTLDRLTDMLGPAPDTLPAPGDGQAPGIVGLLLGPIVRGTAVIVP